jgi:hypothetical protein
MSWLHIRTRFNECDEGFNVVRGVKEDELGIVDKAAVLLTLVLSSML